MVQTSQITILSIFSFGGYLVLMIVNTEFAVNILGDLRQCEKKKFLRLSQLFQPIGFPDLTLEKGEIEFQDPKGKDVQTNFFVTHHQKARLQGFLLDSFKIGHSANKIIREKMGKQRRRKHQSYGGGKLVILPAPLSSKQHPIICQLRKFEAKLSNR